MSVLTVDDFVALVEASQLVPQATLDALKEQMPPHVLLDSKNLAHELVRRRIITRWQSEQLLAGHSRFIFGKYKLLDQIGVGGMGAVYKAEMTAMGRTVALKIMARELLDNAEAVARFQREVKAVSCLNHPNVVAAYDAICEGQTYFLVMEYVDGGNLNQWLKKYHNNMPVDWCVECIRQAALGLQHAHEHGIVHRDIKPGNILVAAESPNKLPVVKILDMGLARINNPNMDPQNLTRQGQVLGTPDYIAPEQAKATRDADIRCDIFSLGVTFFKFLTGRLPYEGETPMEKIMARTERPAPRVSTFRSDVPPGVDQVIAIMLATDPDDRYQTPWEVAQALTPFSLATRLARAMENDYDESSSITRNHFAEMLLKPAHEDSAEQNPNARNSSGRSSQGADWKLVLALGLIAALALAALILRLLGIGF